MGRSATARSPRGQGTVEWLGLLLIAGLLLAALAAAGARLPGLGLAGDVYGRLACAVDLSDVCAENPELVSAYGIELAELVRANAPEIRYEPGSSALPVDFRDCRGPACGNGPRRGAVTASATGIPPTAFVHVVDCRPGAVARMPPREASGCADGLGNVYVQYWLYFENSTSLRAVNALGAAAGVRPGFHEDDWESYQVRIGPGGEVDARASSHRGYDYGGGPRNWLHDAGLTHPSSWGPATGDLFVSGGSHAGHVADDAARVRWTPAASLVLVPIETLDGEALATPFAISPPWAKLVYAWPEATGT